MPLASGFALHIVGVEIIMALKGAVEIEFKRHAGWPAAIILW